MTVTWSTRMAAGEAQAPARKASLVGQTRGCYGIRRTSSNHVLNTSKIANLYLRYSNVLGVAEQGLNTVVGVDPDVLVGVSKKNLNQGGKKRKRAGRWDYMAAQRTVVYLGE